MSRLSTMMQRALRRAPLSKRTTACFSTETIRSSEEKAPATSFSLYLDQRQPNKALGAFQSLQTPPSIAQAQRLAVLLAKEATVEDTSAALDVLKSVYTNPELQPNEYTKLAFIYVADACLRNNLLDEALTVTDKAHTLDVRLDLPAYNNLINALVHRGDLNAALRVFEIVAAGNEITPNAATCTSLVRDLISKCRFVKAKKIVDDTRSSGVVFSSDAYMAFNKALAQAHDQSKGATLLQGYLFLSEMQDEMEGDEDDDDEDDDDDDDDDDDEDDDDDDDDEAIVDPSAMGILRESCFHMARGRLLRGDLAKVSSEIGTAQRMDVQLTVSMMAELRSHLAEVAGRAAEVEMLQTQLDAYEAKNGLLADDEHEDLSMIGMSYSIMDDEVDEDEGGHHANHHGGHEECPHCTIAHSYGKLLRLLVQRKEIDHAMDLLAHARRTAIEFPGEVYELLLPMLETTSSDQMAGQMTRMKGIVERCMDEDGFEIDDESDDEEGSNDRGQSSPGGSPMIDESSEVDGDTSEEIHSLVATLLKNVLLMRQYDHAIGILDRVTEWNVSLNHSEYDEIQMALFPMDYGIEDPAMKNFLRQLNANMARDGVEDYCLFRILDANNE
ncbi:Aste57867_21083 [Aphanomyces stellatus]|uniref:Aste57867_21083 protein n=1 Tax=Aphanomyces stellatus TaxID=120398 RepID=A0A485LHU7_9STRA|nr:hypothetical protein As57867_021015 [Aphanomyces stellatus]VFT97757.1 Aste57867_21083 [Aphanomyces stellatus]